MKQSTKRLLGIVTIGCMAIGAAVFFIYPEFFALPQAGQPLEPVGPAPQSAAAGASAAPEKANTPRMPNGPAVTGQVMRDLFAPPAGYAALLAAPAKGSETQPAGSDKNFSRGSLPALTGVIQGDGARVAILRQGAISRSYRVGQTAGEYRVAAIGPSSVTLSGPSGTTVLTMGK
jgi:hypothetical protein